MNTILDINHPVNNNFLTIVLSIVGAIIFGFITIESTRVVKKEYEILQDNDGIYMKIKTQYKILWLFLYSSKSILESYGSRDNFNSVNEAERWIKKDKNESKLLKKVD